MFDPVTIKRGVSSTVNQWEEAGTSLTTALNKYLELCSSLETNALQEGMRPKELATRIDSALETLHDTLGQQMFKARSTLAQTRNRIRSPINRCPEEVLSEIFANVIYDPPDLSDPIPMADTLVGIYRSTHNLLAVCTVWRDVVLSRGTFWSIVPITEPKSSFSTVGYPQATGLSLARARDADLNLAVIMSYVGNGIAELAQYATRFRSINIVTKSRVLISSILRIIWDLESCPRFSDLSLCRESKGSPYYGLPRDFDYLFPSDSPEQALFENLVHNLSVLRLCGVQCYWDTVAFSDRLVALHLQDLCLGYDSTMAKLIMTLASAINLRDLKFISVKTFPDRVMTQSLMTETKVALPNLQTLLVRDLYANTLDFFLSSITSRSHHLTLHLTSKSLQVIRPRETEPEDVEFEDVADLFSRLSVKTLCIDGEEDYGWMSGLALKTILSSMPSLETLHMSYWDYDDEYLTALRRPHSPNSQSFPWIKNLHFTCARIWDEMDFQDMVSSHLASLERVTLGATLFNSNYNDLDDSATWEPLVGDEDVVLWLEKNVPDFQLVDESYDPVEFQLPEWQLW